ncbi:MAG: NAD(P)/FAD-dependent oxidoreductase [Propionibacteriaceae bacterium]
MTHVQTAIVVGGGIAGPVTAMALQRAGIDLDDPVRHVAEPVSAMIVQAWTGKRLAQFDGPSGKPIMHVVWRPDLYRALYDEATRRGIAIEHSHRFIDARESADGVIARFSDDSTACADILIGADGSRSTVRSMIDPTAPPPLYTGLLGLGGLTTRAGVDPTNANYRMIFGKKAFFGYEVSDEGQISWFANLPHRDPLTLAQAREVSPEEWLRVLRNAFAADQTSAAAIIAATSPVELIVTGGLEIMPTAPVWSRGRSVIVGDAAHVPSPSSGQGASMAIESAIELARCLRDLPYAQAFAAYETLRRDRVTRIIRLAARTNSHKAAGPLARRVRDVIMPMAMKLAKPEKTAWQYNHHIDWDAPATNTVNRRPRLTSGRA